MCLSICLPVSFSFVCACVCGGDRGEREGKGEKGK